MADQSVIDMNRVVDGGGDAAPPADQGPPVDQATPEDAAADLAPPEPDMAVIEEDAAPIPDMAPPAPDMAPEEDMAPPVDAEPPAPDRGPPVIGEACGPCEDDAECVAGVGPGAGCNDLIGGRFCLAGCDDDRDCPAFHACLGNRCTPAGARCDSCAVQGCPAGQHCNGFTGLCEDRAGRCGGCREQVDCQEGLFCREVALGASNCLEPCAQDGGCAPGFECDAGACRPSQGFCDPCGVCPPVAPVCDFLTGNCSECNDVTACPEGQVCAEGGDCIDPPAGVECLRGSDCRTEERPFCQDDLCVACRGDDDCGVGRACQAGACEAVDPCSQITCQAGTQCQDGHCVDGQGLPACGIDADCGADALRCNGATGQCYRADQTCDPDGMTAVCAPGGRCQPAPFGQPGFVCSCARTNPGDFQEPNEAHRIPCQPGGFCLQIGDQPGICTGFGM
ncbi:MAG: hypothetical protein KC620_00165 [Myxococcales bacterium]|nr:hypothetical protein [Myxococcales bacterium]